MVSLATWPEYFILYVIKAPDVVISSGNSHLTKNQVFRPMTPTEGDQQGLFKADGIQTIIIRSCTYNAILCMQKTACKHLGIQLETYDGNKEAKSVKCICACHAWGFQERYGYTSAVDRLDGADKVRSIIYEPLVIKSILGLILQFYWHFCVSC